MSREYVLYALQNYKIKSNIIVLAVLVSLQCLWELCVVCFHISLLDEISASLPE